MLQTLTLIFLLPSPFPLHASPPPAYLIYTDQSVEFIASLKNFVVFSITDLISTGSTQQITLSMKHFIPFDCKPSPSPLYISQSVTISPVHQSVNHHLPFILVSQSPSPLYISQPITISPIHQSVSHHLPCTSVSQSPSPFYISQSITISPIHQSVNHHLPYTSVSPSPSPLYISQSITISPVHQSV